jgi:hypothetical protein
MPDQSVSDQLVFVDDSGQVGFGFNLTESLGLLDSVAWIDPGAARIQITDRFFFQENSGVTLLTQGYVQLGASASDTFSFSDRVDFSPLNLFTETLPLVDTVTTLVQNTTVFASVSDTFAFNDSLLVSLYINVRAVPDSLAMVDAFGFFSPYITAVSDTGALSDAVGLSPVAPLGADAVSLSDAVATNLVNLIIGSVVSTADILALADSIQFTASNLFVSVGDYLSVTDGAGSAAADANADDNSYFRRYLNDAI